MNSKKMKRRLVNAGFKVVASYDEDFELTDSLKSDLEKYGFMDDIELLGEEDDEVKAKLKPEVVKELERTYKTFLDYPTEKDLGDAKKHVEEKTLQFLEINYPEYNWGVAVSDRIQDRYVGSSSGALFIEISLYNDSGARVAKKTLEPGSLYYTGEEFADTPSWSWLYWLAYDNSPFEDSGFREAYEYDQIVRALEQFASTAWQESDLESEIEKEAKTLIEKYKEKK